MTHIKKMIADTVDPLPFAYCQNRSTDDAANNVTHATLTHSAFNPHKLSVKLLTLGLTPALCNGVLIFLSGRP